MVPIRKIQLSLLGCCVFHKKNGRGDSQDILETASLDEQIRIMGRVSVKFIEMSIVATVYDLIRFLLN